MPFQFLWCYFVKRALFRRTPIETDFTHVGCYDQNVGFQFSSQQATAQILVDDRFDAMQRAAIGATGDRDAAATGCNYQCAPFEQPANRVETKHTYRQW